MRDFYSLSFTSPPCFERWTTSTDIIIMLVADVFPVQVGGNIARWRGWATQVVSRQTCEMEFDDVKQRYDIIVCRDSYAPGVLVVANISRRIFWGRAKRSQKKARRNARSAASLCSLPFVQRAASIRGVYRELSLSSRA